MYSKKTTVINKTGLHARPASVFVKKAKEFSSDITITNLNTPEEKPGNAKTIFGVLRLAMVQGTEVLISAEGTDEEEAVTALIELIESGFGE